MNSCFLLRGIICNTVCLRSACFFANTVSSSIGFDKMRSFSVSLDEMPNNTVCYVWGGGNKYQNLFSANATKQLLDPVIFPAPLPTNASADTSKPSPIVDISFGHHHAIILTKDGLIYTMGIGKYDELGLGEDIKKTEIPLQVPGISNVIQVVTGKYHSMALTRDGEVFTWGRPGSLGHPKSQWWYFNQDPCPTPTRVKALSGIKAIASGLLHSIALTHEGSVFSWGKGEFGRLGHGGAGNKAVPEHITAFDGLPIKAIHCGSAFNAALSKDNELWVWGRNDKGQCANAESLQVDIMRQESIPAKIDSFPNSNLVSIACGGQQMAAVTSDHELYQWGNGVWLEPTRVDGDNKDMLKVKILDATVGKGFSFALDDKGRVFSWGIGGQLGLGHTQKIVVPQAIEGFGPDVDDKFGRALKVITGLEINSRVAAIVVKGERTS